jgi:hypothetical protein
MGGNDDEDNLVMFTAKEHYIAHLLLTKMYPTSHGLYYAAFMMGSNGRTSRLYSNLREFVSTTNSVRNTGRLKTDYTGMKIGRLTVKRYIPDFNPETKRKPKWECICDCGNTTYLATQYLSDGRIKSCGCLLSEVSRDKMLGKERALDVRIKISETLKARTLMKPWANTRLKDEGLVKWLDADKIFKFWKCNSEPKSKTMTDLYNNTYGTQHKRSYFKTIVQYFINGWVPYEDVEWARFKGEYEE